MSRVEGTGGYLNPRIDVWSESIHNRIAQARNLRPTEYLVEHGSLAVHLPKALFRQVPPAVVDDLDRSRQLSNA